MPKSYGNKLRLLYVLDILRKKSDVEHPVSVPDILVELDKLGISVERKAVYDDIEALREFGYEIEQKRGKNAGYYIESRDFELSELKLLVDAVQSSKFISADRSRELIAKLTALAGAEDAKQLERQVFVANRVKTSDAAALANIDAIHSAIARNRRVEFYYTDWAVDFAGGERFVRERRGERRSVSPVALVWDDENYYLVAYSSEHGARRHYRVDKMERVEVGSSPRDPKGEYTSFDPGAYSRQMFGMFRGESRRVQLRFRNDFAGVAVDRLGREAQVSPGDREGWFNLSCEVGVSPQFFAWIVGLEGGAELLGPKGVRDEFRKFIGRAAESCGE